MSGLGIYPGDPCFDASRPEWLPYWVDDFTESDCKWNATNILGATVNAFEDPNQVAQNVGGVIGQGAGAAISDVASGVEAGIQGSIQTLSPGGAFIVAGAGIVAVIVLMELLKK